MLHPLPVEHPQCTLQDFMMVIDPYWSPPEQHLTLTHERSNTDAVIESTQIMHLYKTCFQYEPTLSVHGLGCKHGFVLKIIAL